MRMQESTKLATKFATKFSLNPDPQVTGKPAARGGAGVRKQGSGFSAPGINNEVTYENARIDKARDKVRDKVFPEP
jgi:hypothetical protein